MTGPSLPPHDPLECGGFLALLAAARQGPDGALGHGAAQVHAPGAPGLSATRVWERLAAHARACRPCRERHASRLAEVQGLCALRSRGVPDGWLDRLGDDVLARARARGGGMSPAFLDAPHSLAQWRWAALAASVLVAVGAGLLLSGRVAWHDPGSSPERRDGWVELRDVALMPWDTPRSDDPPSEAVERVVFGRRSPNVYWDSASVGGHVIIHPVVAPSKPAPPSGR